jgi:hypothetical protein
MGAVRTGREVEMVPRNRLGAVLAILVMLSASVAAQWPAHPTSRVPRLADGTPDLAAPAPRTDDGRPDLSGKWENFRTVETARAVNAEFFDETPDALIDLFRDAGGRIDGGLPYQPWAADLRARRMADNSKDNPDAHCLPMGFMQFHTHPQPRQIVQTRDLILFVYEANHGLRYVFLDGRPLPPQGEPQPWWYGYSIGRWEGDALVVETNNLIDGIWLDVNGSPLTEAAHVTERFRRPDFGHLQIDVTVDDPKVYTRPWTVSLAQRIMVDAELIEFVCAEYEVSSRRYR